MIAVGKTLNDTVLAYYNKLRYLGQTNDCTWEKTLFMVIVRDVAMWADFLDVSPELQQKLHDLQQQFILKNSDFVITRTAPDVYATNVNTPQTSWTWRTINWDVTTDSAKTITELEGIDMNCDYIPKWHTITQAQFEDLKQNISTMSDTDKKDYWLVYDVNNVTDTSNSSTAGKPYYFHPVAQEFKPFIDLLGEGLSMEDIVNALKIQLNHSWEDGALNREAVVQLTDAVQDSLKMITKEEAEGMFDE